MLFVLLLINVIFVILATDKCLSGTSKCSQYCHSTKDSYECSCEEKNYKLDSNKQTCHRTNNSGVFFIR